MENVSLEQRLAQKIMSMENAAARISAVRAELKTNTDQTRKDVKAVISEQMLLLRAREQELMNELDMISSGRESALEYQQHSLYTLIGECKRLVRNLKESDGSSTYAASMISRLSFVDDVDEDWAHVSFESDATGLQSSLSSFGTIHATMSNHINEAKNTIEKNLLMEIEDSDNNAVMAQKPVLAKKSSENPKKVGKQQVETVRKWLKETSSDSAAALDPDITSALVEYDFIKNSSLSESESSDSASSFELITQDSSKTSTSTRIKEVLSAEFLNTLQQPLSSWLMRVIPKEETPFEVKPCNVAEKPVSAMKRPYSAIHEKHYEFEDVINSVRASSNDCWVIGSKRSKKPCTEMTCHKEEASTSEQECEAFQAIPSFNEKEFLEQLSNLFVCKMKSSSQLQMTGESDAYEIDLSTVLGWKRVLEKIEQSASFWLQDKKP